MVPLRRLHDAGTIAPGMLRLRFRAAVADELLQRLSAVPSAPEHVWQAGHPFGDMMWGLPEHDRHHAMQIKNARIGGTAPLEA